MPRFVTTLAALACLAAALAPPAEARTPSIFKEFREGQQKLNAGDLDGAIADFTAVIEHDKAEKVEVQWLSYSHFYRGEAFRRQKNFDAAIPDFDRTLELTPDLAPAWFQRGLIRHEQERYRDAIGDFDKAIELQPDDPEYLYTRCVSKSWVNDNQGVLADCGRAVELKPDFVNALLVLGRGYEDLKRKPDAIATYRKVLELDPGNSSAKEGIAFLGG